MKLVSATAVMLMVAAMATAQTSGAPRQAQGTSASPAASTQTAPGQTAVTQNPAAQATIPAPNPNRQPQAKTREEFDAYKAGASLTDPNQILAAADQFAQKFPSSELKELLYVQAMNLFQQQSNPEKEIEAGRKAIAVDPTDPVPLIHVASALVEVTKDNDLDKDQRFAEAAKYAQAAIDNIEIGLHIPPNVSPQQVQAVKNNIVAPGYETLGVIQMNKQDFAAAEADFKKAVDASRADPIARIYLRLSVAQDNEKKYTEALDSANQALKYSQEGSVEQNLAKQQQSRLQRLTDSGSTSSVPSPGATPAPAAPPNPATQSPQPH
jgi:tetratricopeptide (TPR) repeat protein